MKYLLLLPLVFSLAFVTAEKKEKEKISLQDVLDSKKVSAKVISRGGHQDECIDFKIRNLTDSLLSFYIEPGRRLVSEDSNMQDIFIVKSTSVVLGPREEKSFPGVGYCCQSTNGSPSKNARFNFGQMTDKGWVNLAHYIDSNYSHLNSSTIQSAVWVLSDSINIASVSDSDESSYKLKVLVAAITGSEMPNYTIIYKQDTSMVFTGTPSDLRGWFEIDLKHNGMVTAMIRHKSTGLLMTYLIKEKAFNRGKHKEKYDLSVESWPKGTYELLVYEGYNNLNKREAIVIR